MIPQSIISIISDMTARRETHAGQNSLFLYSGAPGEPPIGNKNIKATEWIYRVNKDFSIDPLEVLGKLIEKYVEADADSSTEWGREAADEVQKLLTNMERHGLHYRKGGLVVSGAQAPSKSLEQFIKERNLKYFDEEFSRALKNVDTSPRDSVSAASNLLETICKVYIDENGLERPAKLDLAPVWTVVKKHLGFDPSVVEDGDLQKILTGLFSVVSGIGDLRTHASTAHGTGKSAYKIEPRHARLAVHSAHTVSLFILETWEKRKTRN